ncbi:hypothetical protein [Halorarius litoreus]|uniref:hypothetical protein n=1 Tax=Halorarius litoreus TaxID=2962676 RepID=UPI0020CBDD5B|nr:hypothetical protein [Halorarius litoreus]
MSPEERRDSIDGLELDDAVDAVTAADETHDPEAVRAALDYVTDDEGVVREAAVDPAFGELSKVVSTPETRVELAQMALDDARETAEPVADIDAVAARLDDFEARVDALDARVEALGEQLGSLIDDHGEAADLYETAEGIRALTDEANRVQVEADELQQHLEAFERWVDTESLRLDELEEDVAAAESEVDDLVAAVEKLDAVLDQLDPDAADELVAGWLHTTVGRRVTDLLLTDLRAEIEDLRAWPGGVEDTDRLAAIEADVDELAERTTATAETLDALVAPEWDERFGDRLADLDAALDAVEPPVDWGAVQEIVEEHRVDPETLR